MSALYIPGFTAESSLYKVRAHYTGRRQSPNSGRVAVSPAAFVGPPAFFSSELLNYISPGSSSWVCQRGFGGTAYCTGVAI
jgi:hypothetical protein